MLNFESMNTQYRERIFWRVDDLLDRMIVDHLLKGGSFDAQKMTKFFDTVVRTAQLITDLEIGTGLCPLKEEKDGKESETTRNETQNGCTPNVFIRDEVVAEGDEVDNLREGDTQGPSGGFGNAIRVRDSAGESDSPGDNRATGGGEVNTTE